MDPDKPALLLRLAARTPAIKGLMEDRESLSRECDELREQRAALVDERDELKKHLKRLSNEVGQFTELAAFQGKEIEALRGQRDALAAERDELLEHARSLLAEIEVSNDREMMMQEATQSSNNQRNTLELERDELKTHGLRLIEEREEMMSRLEAVESELRRLRRLLWAEPGHYYSPVVDPGEERVQMAANGKSLVLEYREDFVLDEGKMMQLFDCISSYYPVQPFTPAKALPNRYYFENTMFSYADAITLYGILRHFKPKRLVEAGCGYSSCATMDTNDLFFNGELNADYFDPNPEAVLSLIGPADKYRERVYPLALQEIPLDVFTGLEENDILLLDSSHVAKTASDVNDYLFRVLPALKPGVLVHVHDVPYPFEYPAAWILNENRSWNELYCVRAFLQYNSKFEVIYWNSLVYNKYRDRTAERMPLCLKNTGGSLWLRKV